ncbi:FUSC family protein [Starkeya sp. ORNL1]|uniref:FUSC family protein n=1 Tax=Starkeya sp. ORNL1 TaxID=2709380 RepID=UPI00146491D0|nr:FUSC family protein [Starkeya sp. ORNL1]QJP17349.1 FUSC family protein [Starkeya sp. ORNL1]
MSVAEAERRGAAFRFPIDLGWRNFVFALRTALAAVTALAIAYWLELSDPQWATLTVYLLAQPTAGAAVAKGAWRTVGTVCGALVGLVVVGMFSQAPELLVAAIALLIGLVFYAGARVRNYTSYGVLIGGYTMLLIGFEGSSDPLNAWSIALDRTSEILIGIACITAASVIVLPRYAGDVLRASLAGTFSGLSRYGAAALRPSTPAARFIAQRRRMVEQVVTFDALRSYTVFEAPEMRANDEALRKTTREFLRVLAIARGLFFRLEDFREEGADTVLARLSPALAATVATLERIAAESGTLDDPGRIEGELSAAGAALDAASAELEAMAGTVPFEPLANAVLVVRRATDLLHQLSLVICSEAASVRAGPSPAQPRAVEPAPPQGHREAVLLGLRAAFVIAVVSLFWTATGWSQGFTAMSGAAIMLFFGVNQDNAIRGGRSFMLWAAAGIAVAYLGMMMVLPRIEGFEALALFLVVALLPAGLMAGTPAYAWPGIAFGGFIISELGTSNLFTQDVSGFVNGGAAILLGMAGSLVLLGVLPVTSRATRARAWNVIVGRLLPEAARGAPPERTIVAEILAMVGVLLPRLALDLQDDEDFLRGGLGAASASVELGRLSRAGQERTMPPAAAHAIAECLTRFAALLEDVARPGADRAAMLAQAEAVVAQARRILAGLVLEPGSPAARAVVRAGASLRFIDDRFGIDRPFLLRSFADE